MTDFRTWFTEHAIYLFPDGTPVVAQFFDAGDNPGGLWKRARMAALACCWQPSF